MNRTNEYSHYKLILLKGTEWQKLFSKKQFFCLDLKSRRYQKEYIWVKIEKIIKSNNNDYIIIRLPEIIGKSKNPNTLTNFSYRVLKDDCLDLPPKTFMKRIIQLTPEQDKVYKQMKMYNDEDTNPVLYKDKS
mgnify:CR=1 FL=1